MKKSLLIICISLIGGIGFANTQQGIVKTKGRLNADQTITKGEPLSDAFVTIQGAQTVSSNKKGAFSVTLTSKDYYLKDVCKEGYVLCDADALSRSYAYSPNPMYIVMETPSQQMEDKLRAERNLRRTLQRQLEQRQDEIDSLKSQQQISEEEYHRQLQQLYSEQEENVGLIKQMSERYASIDYDQLDGFNRRISALILEGKLTTADSLIRSKGSIESRAEALKVLREKNQQEEQAIKKRLKALEKSKAHEQKKLEDIARDCYSLHEIFKMQHKNDSAAYYLEFRASLDTTNVEWLLETGNFLMFYIADFDKAIFYFSKALSMDNPNVISEQSVKCRNDLGFAYAQKEEIDSAMFYYQEALSIAQIIGDQSMESDIYVNMGDVYIDLGDYENAKKYYELSLAKVNEEDYESHAIILGNLGNMYCDMGKYEEALRYLNQAISISSAIGTTDLNSTLAALYGNAADVYCKLGDHTSAIDYCQKAFKIFQELYGEIHPTISNVYATLGWAYSISDNDSVALKYKEKSLDIKIRIFGEYSPKLSVSYNNLAKLYSKLGQSDRAIDLYLKALKIQQEHLGETHFSCAIINNNIGFEYRLNGEYQQALGYYIAALNILREIENQGNLNPQIVGTLNNIACAYQNMGEYKQSISYFLQCIDYAKKIYDTYPPSFTTTIKSADTSYRKAIKETPKDKKLLKEYAAFKKEYKSFLEN